MNGMDSSTSWSSINCSKELEGDFEVKGGEKTNFTPPSTSSQSNSSEPSSSSLTGSSIPEEVLGWTGRTKGEQVSLSASFKPSLNTDLSPNLLDSVTTDLGSSMSSKQMKKRSTSSCLFSEGDGERSPLGNVQVLLKDALLTCVGVETW